MENHTASDAAQIFEAKRARLFGLAYRMLGSRADAEDIVQESYLRWHKTDFARVENPEAFLVTTATRLSIDRLRKLKTEREAYIGPWVPEPLIANTPAPDHDLELSSNLSLAFLTLLETLAPDERAALLLHEVFDVGYGEIASILDRSEAACRQVVHRARERVRSDQKRFEPSEQAKQALLHTFAKAVQARDREALLNLFTKDAVWIADSGGKVPAAGRPLTGIDSIVALLLAVGKSWAETRRIEFTTVNGEPGLCVWENGVRTGVMSIASDGEKISAVYAVLNPDKLV